LLERITIEYIEHEDRFCLNGLLATGEAIKPCLKQRLLNRLIPHLFSLLEQQTGNTPLAEVRQ
jgi:hypothetical protein